MRYKTKRKTGTYEHFCIVIIAQNPWKENDRESIRRIALEQRRNVRDQDYHFYHRLTHRNSEPENSLCTICKYVYRFLTELTDNRDYILYQGHHYILGEDFPDLLEFSKFLVEHEKIKKIFILDLDPLDEFKVDEIDGMSFNELKSLIIKETYILSEFENILRAQYFKKRILYEITKDSYYQEGKV